MMMCSRPRHLKPVSKSDPKKGMCRAGRALALERPNTERALKSLEQARTRLSSLPNWVWRGVILVLCMLWATNFAVIKDGASEPWVLRPLGFWHLGAESRKLLGLDPIEV